MFHKVLFTVLFLCFFTIIAQAQVTGTSTTNNSAHSLSNEISNKPLSLNDCISLALKSQPAINQAYLDEAIAKSNNKIAWSGWLPQVTGSANYTNYFQLPTSFTRVNGVLTPIQGGVKITSIPAVIATQTIFNPEVMLATKAAKLNTQQAKLGTDAVKINLVADVSKAFYNLLLSIAQTGVYREDTARLKKNQLDALNRYKSGIADKVDYKQATISLNNSLSQLKTASETVFARYAQLKQVMGYTGENNFDVAFDTSLMLREIYTDTLATLQIEKRIEYQQLKNLKQIQKESTNYYKLAWLPSVSAFYSYNQAFQNNNYGDLYSKAYPYSLFGLQLNIPLFTGFRRVENLHKAHLQEQRTDWDEVNLKLAIYAQYKQAMASYKSNLYYLQTQAENKDMAREVYNIVKLQYSEGIKPYLDVIVAESQLQTAEINYLNSLYQLLASKIDLEKAMGTITTL